MDCPRCSFSGLHIGENEVQTVLRATTWWQWLHHDMIHHREVRECGSLQLFCSLSTVPYWTAILRVMTCIWNVLPSTPPYRALCNIYREICTKTSKHKTLNSISTVYLSLLYLCFITGGWKYNWKGMFIHSFIHSSLMEFLKIKVIHDWDMWEILDSWFTFFQKGETVKKMREEVGLILNGIPNLYN